MWFAEKVPEPARWKEEIVSYLSLRLKDPSNAVVDFKTEPKQFFQRQVGLDPQMHGWAVCVWIRDRNKAGQWQDAFPMTVFIRNDKIIYEWYAEGHSASAKHYTASMAKAIIPLAKIASKWEVDPRNLRSINTRAQKEFLKALRTEK